MPNNTDDLTTIEEVIAREISDFTWKPDRSGGSDLNGWSTWRCIRAIGRINRRT